MTPNPNEPQPQPPAGDAPDSSAWRQTVPIWVPPPPASPYGIAWQAGGPQPGSSAAPAGPSYPGPPYGGPPSGGPPYGAPPYGGGLGGPPSWQPEDPGAEAPQPRRRSITAVVVALALLVSAALGFGAARQFRGTTTASGNGAAPSLNTVPNGVAPDNSSLSAQAASVAGKVDPGIVDINTVLYGGGTAAGTGMVLSASGEVLTNNHVVAGSSSIKATLVSNGRVYDATLVGTDASHDVAVIQLTGASGLKTIPLGDSSSVAIGQTVVALGNALGAGGTPSVVQGTVRDLDQTIVAGDLGGGSSERLSGLIQTDAPLQPGDSGGPLSTTDGKVIGMDTAASSNYRFQNANGYSFAIPINTALTIAKQMEAGQASSTIHLGQSGFLGVQVDNSSTGGAIVLGVEPNTPASAAGMASGDVVTGVDSTNVTTGSALTTILGAHHPGDKVTVHWTDRSGQARSASVTLATGPAQ